MKKQLLFLLFVLMPLAGCTTHQTSPPSVTQNSIATSLSTVNAEFTTRVYGTGSDALTHGHLWRSPTRVEWLDITTNTSEIWTKTSQNLWFYSKAFHADQQVIEYSPVDLNLLQVAPAWQSFAAAINPALLQKLPKTREISPLGDMNRIQYRGTIDQVTYEVDWLPELALATRVKTVEKGVTRVTELKQPLLTSDDSKAPQNISRYRFIEYSDLG
ncbi:hypothetical protein, partial [Cellvibrio sp.]